MKARGIQRFFSRGLAALLFVLSLGVAGADDFRGRYDLLFYGGRYSQTTFLDIMLRGETDYRESYIFAGGLNRLMESDIRPWTFETEGLLVAHTGVMRHVEADGLLIARLRPFKSLPLTLAFGEGLSVASRRPDLERPGKNLLALRFQSQKTNPVLNYIMLEADYGLGGAPYYWRIFMRLHHRSGIFGTYCSGVCGSNFISYGIKMSL